MVLIITNQAPALLPANPARKKLAITNESVGDAFWAWHRTDTHPLANTGEHRGQRMTPGQTLDLDGPGVTHAIMFIAVDGASGQITWEEALE